MVCHAIIIYNNFIQHMAPKAKNPANKEEGFNLSLCFNYFNAYYFVHCIYTVILKKDILDIHLHHI